MSNIVLAALCALTLGAETPAVNDTTVYYMIDGKVAKNFNGSQLNGKTIASYRIDCAKDEYGHVSKVHFIKTTSARKDGFPTIYYVNDVVVSEADFQKVKSSDIKQMLVFKAGSEMAMELTGNSLSGVVKVILKDGSKPETPAALEEVTVVSYGTKKETAKTYSTAEDAIALAQVDVKPTFQGGPAHTFSKWVNERLNYPASAREAGIQGRVFLSFKVNSNGKVSDVKVLKGVCTALDDEAVRVVSSSPDWTPGKHKGKNVAVIFTFPVNFAVR